jgi:hypothetical protein
VATQEAMVASLISGSTGVSALRYGSKFILDGDSTRKSFDKKRNNLFQRQLF